MQNIFWVFVSGEELIALTDPGVDEHTVDTSLEKEDSLLHSVDHVPLVSCTCKKTNCIETQMQNFKLCFSLCLSENKVILCITLTKWLNFVNYITLTLTCYHVKLQEKMCNMLYMYNILLKDSAPYTKSITSSFHHIFWL